MTERLEKIFSVLPSCEVFADVGCDHGYLAKAMLDSGKCRRAIVSDISAKCLKKAQDLLCDYIADGTAESVVSDGFKSVKKCDLALIAGMGGEEIVSIINSAPFLPEKLVLQPMKNPQKVRLTVVQAGYKIVSDFTFFSLDKYYDLLVLERGKDSLTNEEIEFGRTNILQRPDGFIRFIKEKIKKYEEILSSDKLGEKARREIALAMEKLKKYVKD